MAEADPLSMQKQVETTNLKALAELTNQLVAAFNTITVNSSQNFTATMDALNKQLTSNLDFANKVMGTRLEVDPVESASTDPLAAGREDGTDDSTCYRVTSRRSLLNPKGARALHTAHPRGWSVNRLRPLPKTPTRDLCQNGRQRIVCTAFKRHRSTSNTPP